MSYRQFIRSAIVLLLVTLIPTIAYGQDASNPITVSVETSYAACGLVSFSVVAEGGSEPFDLLWEYGDEETTFQTGVTSFPQATSHPYTTQGGFQWGVLVTDVNGGTGYAEGTVEIAGPSIELTSNPFPPILDLQAGETSVEFMAATSGGSPPFVYEWDLNGDGIPESDIDLTATVVTATFEESGKYTVSVKVTDNCGFSDVATLPVIASDLEEENEACHPTAQQIATDVNTLFPDQAETLYTCQDIFDIFRGALTGSQVGFGRLKHAYLLATSIGELTWEEIRDWQLINTFGWGSLVQLDRFAGLLEDHSIVDLMDMVLSGENSIQEIRGALRFYTRFEADFDDALQRLVDGASPGELGQFYRVVQDLGIDSETLDGYLQSGMTLSEIRHSAKVAEQTGSTDWEEIALAHSFGASWGEIGQALRMAGETMTSSEILEMGVKEFRALQREQVRIDRQTEKETNRSQLNDDLGDRMADKYQVDVSVVMDLYNGTCESSWSCVRKELRSQSQGLSGSGKDQQTAARLARQFGTTEGNVWNLFYTTCSEDWKCVQSNLRDQAREDKGNGKPDK